MTELGTDAPGHAYLRFRLLLAALVLVEAAGLLSLADPGAGTRRSASGGIARSRQDQDGTWRPPRALHVTPYGSTDGDGTVDRPIDLATALSKAGPARPGDTIWMHGGTYRGAFVSDIAGEAGLPIIVRQAPGERAIIDGAGAGRDALLVNGSWTWFWGFEVTNSDVQRTTLERGSWPALRRGAGITAHGPHLKFINLVVHDAGDGLGIWEDAVDTEAYGNVIYYNGWHAPDRGHGHGIYTQNAAPSTRTIRDNIIFNQFSHGIHAYGSERAALDNMVLEGNVAFNNGSMAGDLARDILIGGGRVARQPIVRDNFTYGLAQSNIGYAAGCDGGIITGNYFGQGAFVLARCQPLLERNTFVGPLEQAGEEREYPANTFHAGKPTGTVVQVRPNEYEPGRAHVVVYNWDTRPSVFASLHGICRRHRLARFEVKDAQNFYGPAVATGVCSDPTVLLPLTGLSPALPVGEVPEVPRHTAPEFATFVVLPVSERDGGPSQLGAGRQ